MNRNIFEIEQSMLNLLDYGVDDTTGEIATTQEEFNEMYEKISLELNTKIDNTNCLIKMLNGEVDVIDTEIKRLQSEKKSREKRIEWLTNLIDTFVRKQFTDEMGNLDNVGLNKYKLNLNHSKIAYRKSEKVEISNIDSIPTEYINEVIEKKPNKDAIKQAIKDGKVVSGAQLVSNCNIQIK